MGCIESTIDKEILRNMKFEDIPYYYANDWNLFPPAIVKWLEQCVIKVGCKLIQSDNQSFMVDYVLVSRPGLYPTQPNRQTQDYYLLHDQLEKKHGVNPNTTLFFGVFDGHGPYGDKCSQFVASNLERQLDTCKTLYDDFPKNIKELLTNCDHMLENDIHAPKDEVINDHASGTTACCLLIYKDQLICYNIGDSRCITGIQDHNNIVAHPFTIDHNPNLPNERERIYASGGCIETHGQRLGITAKTDVFEYHHKCDGDPPRVWLKDRDFPGTAFTRSIGDRCAKSIGVCCDADVFVHPMCSNVRYIALASDGVTEFMTNQEIMNIIAAEEDPRENDSDDDENDTLERAAMHIVVEAYRRWVLKEECTDDITLFLLKIHSHSARSYLTLNKMNFQIHINTSSSYLL
ncbi:hypothetical protein WA158_005471 [Blastocystis sp. Blastoise]